jgi:hypothetical protein
MGKGGGQRWGWLAKGRRGWLVARGGGLRLREIGRRKVVMKLVLHLLVLHFRLFSP